MTKDEAGSMLEHLIRAGMDKNPHRLWIFRIFERIQRGEAVNSAVEKHAVDAANGGAA